MNLFGLEISLARKNNPHSCQYEKKLVTEDSCRIARDAMGQRVDDLKGHIDTRFEDMKDFIRKNGR